MFKVIMLDDKESQYYIDETGDLLNKKTNRHLKGRVSGGYLYHDLRFNGKRYTRRVNRLVAEAFLDNPKNLPVVNHKDGNKLNNHVDNLEWCSYSENNKHAYDVLEKVKKGKKSEKYDRDLSGEKWKQLFDSSYYISNMGRVCNRKTKNILLGKVTANGYIEYCLTVNGVKKSYLAHRLVYSVFHNIELKKEDFINHINGDKTCNQLENLEKVTNQENQMHACYVIKTNPQCKKVYQYSLQGEILGVYPSCAEAARQNPGCYANLISNVCNGKKQTHHGFIWSYDSW